MERIAWKSVERLVSRPSLLISARVTCLAGSNRARSYRLRSRLSFATLPLPILGSSWFLATFLTNIAKRDQTSDVSKCDSYETCTRVLHLNRSIVFFFFLRSFAPECQKNVWIFCLSEWTWDEFLFSIFKYRINKS